MSCEYCGNHVVVPGKDPDPEPRPHTVININRFDRFDARRGTKGTVPGGGRVAAVIIAVILAGVAAAVAVSLSESGGDLAALTGSSTRLQAVFGVEGTGVGQLDEAREIGIDADGNVYLGEFRSGRVQRFTPDGEPLDQFFVVSGAVPLTQMLVSRDGTVMTVEGVDVHRYDGSTGQHLGQITWDDGIGFLHLTAVAALPDGGYLLAERDVGTRLVWVDADGAVQRRVDTPLTPSDDIDRLAVDGQGTIYSLGQRLDRGQFDHGVYVFSREGTLRTFFGGSGNEPGQFNLALGIAVDGQSRVAVSTIFGVQLFDGDGRYLDTLATNPSPFGVAFDDENRLWVTNQTEVLRADDPFGD